MSDGPDYEGIAKEARRIGPKAIVHLSKLLNTKAYLFENVIAGAEQTFLQMESIRLAREEIALEGDTPIETPAVALIKEH